MNNTTSKDGTKLYYDIYGAGPALIYVTGAVCFRKFKPIVKDAKFFARNFKVYTYDRRGRGHSGNTLPYSVEREIEDLGAIIDAAGGSAFLFGHSSGAVLALEAALRMPSKVSRLSLFDPPYVQDEKEKLQYSVLRAHVKDLIDRHRNAQALRTFLSGIGMPKFFVYLLPLMPGWKEMKALAPTLEYDMILTSDTPPVDRATGMRVPTQIIYGEKSPPLIHAVSRQLAQAIPNSTLKQLNGQNHMASPESLLPLLTSFFHA